MLCIIISLLHLLLSVLLVLCRLLPAASNVIDVVVSVDSEEVGVAGTATLYHKSAADVAAVAAAGVSVDDATTAVC